MEPRGWRKVGVPASTKEAASGRATGNSHTQEQHNDDGSR